MSQPVLSLCMIVRDSSRTLPACLQSIRPWVDEIIVVDTGSVDDTREIARSFGAQVHEFPWIDDFSAARNVSLGHATGRWLLWMDADDTIDADNGRCLRALAYGQHGPNVLGYIVQVKCPSPCLDGGEQVTVVDHLKLIQNHPQIRFEGRIHEQVLGAVRRLNGEIGWTDLFVVHSGVDYSPQAKQRKLERDLRILQLDLAERPNHPFVLFNLGMTYEDAGDPVQAVSWLEKCLALSQFQESHVRKAYALLVGSLNALGRVEEARQRCSEGLKHFPKDSELLFRQGITLHRARCLHEAADSYRKALREREARHFDSIDPAVRGYKARHNLALVYAEQGRHDLSELQWRSIVEELPDYRPGWSSLGDSLIQQKKFSALEQVLDTLRNRPAFDVECRLLAGESAMAKQDFDAAWQCLEQFPQGATEEIRFQRLRCHYLFHCGMLDEAQMALEHLLICEPSCPMSLHLLGAVYHRQQKQALAAEALRRSLALRPDAPQTKAHLEVVEEALRVAQAGSGSSGRAPSDPTVARLTGAVTHQPRSPSNGHEQSLAKRKFEWVSLAQLVAATRRLASRLPGNIAGIVGIPRSGMIPASILATLLQSPLYELTGDGSIRPLNHGGRGHLLGWAGAADGPFVVVDDTIYGGGSMNEVRRKTAQHRDRLIYAAVFVRPEVAGLVDIHEQVLPSPHLLEWNFFNSGVLVGASIDPVLWGGAALDFDGILCHDPTVPDGDEGPSEDAYVSWLTSATPRWLPRRLPVKCIITARLERWRSETEEWLRAHGVNWDRLIMHPAQRMSERNASDVAAWKAEQLLACGCRLFMESDPRQAERIHHLSGLPVICPDAEQVFQ